MSAVNVVSVSVTVSDMERSVDFYSTILSCVKINDREVTGQDIDQLYGLNDITLRLVTLQLGEQMMELIEFITPKGRPIPPNLRSLDRAFQHIAIVVSDMEKAYQQIEHYDGPYGILSKTSNSPQTIPNWNRVAGGIQAFYFKDPDGHNLELIHFPEGKGKDEWHQPTSSLFLGIDHTAIVIANTIASRAFYCDLLGLKLQQESRNLGLEQERLSAVENARVHVSSLSASSGLGIELLEYMEPHNGHPIPIDTCANDLWFWQTTIVVEDLMTQVQRLQSYEFPLAEIKGIEIPALGLKRSLLIRDPDGHTVRLTEICGSDFV